MGVPTIRITVGRLSGANGPHESHAGRQSLVCPPARHLRQRLAFTFDERPHVVAALMTVRQSDHQACPSRCEVQIHGP